ncbi:UDP-glycosyltransferase 90A1 [Acorus gramineus]|uniref:Glycosyltransferase n=1 Tax=Acorus gramineus TaxID=55184 RepID=A0AAV9B9B4_ACOGR|nr:UDP-glycosyltransferase 90A1 [Acorus gramineus]
MASTTSLNSPPRKQPKVLIFPFMSKGHTIPLIHLAHLLHTHHNLSITFFTTPLNSPFIRASLSASQAEIVELPFPTGIDGLPPGIESTDKLPSMSLFLPFIDATRLLKPHFERELARLLAHADIRFMVADCFHSWAQGSASARGVPGFVFYGMGNFPMTASRIVAVDRPHARVVSDDEPFSLGVGGDPLAHVTFTKSDLNPPFADPDPDPADPQYEFIIRCAIEISSCRGIIVNSFYELESRYVDYWNERFGLLLYNVGPLCPTGPARQSVPSNWSGWLDMKRQQNRPVLYVAFGTQAEVSETQLNALAYGLENSGVDFMWVVRNPWPGLAGFEARLGERGFVVREWVDQVSVLGHEGVRGFLSHCGWNSVMESVCARVPLLAWPMMAEQFMNARLVVDELGIGLRVRTRDGKKRGGFVEAEEIERMVWELMVGEKGRVAAERVEEVNRAARRAIEVGGSSERCLGGLVGLLCGGDGLEKGMG